jgi:hypothetical protein
LWAGSVHNAVSVRYERVSWRGCGRRSHIARGHETKSKVPARPVAGRRWKPGRLTTVSIMLCLLAASLQSASLQSASLQKRGRSRSVAERPRVPPQWQYATPETGHADRLWGWRISNAKCGVKGDLVAPCGFYQVCSSRTSQLSRVVHLPFADLHQLRSVLNCGPFLHCRIGQLNTPSARAVLQPMSSAFGSISGWPTDTTPRIYEGFCHSIFGRA